jgi:hypothetical protein
VDEIVLLTLLDARGSAGLGSLRAGGLGSALAEFLAAFGPFEAAVEAIGAPFAVREPLRRFRAIARVKYRGLPVKNSELLPVDQAAIPEAIPPCAAHDGGVKDGACPMPARTTPAGAKSPAPRVLLYSVGVVASPCVDCIPELEELVADPGVQMVRNRSLQLGLANELLNIGEILETVSRHHSRSEL